MSAIFSDCGRYRYRLDREIGGTQPSVAFLLHNPSVAGHIKNDPTAVRGIGFARRWSARRLIFINPWAGIATKKESLWRMSDPVGPLNDWHIQNVASEIANEGGFIVFAWGAVSPPAFARASAFDRLLCVESMCILAGCDVRVLGTNSDGSPKHPLYLPADLPPVAWLRAA